jgi:hypothetical protein
MNSAATAKGPVGDGLSFFINYDCACLNAHIRHRRERLRDSNRIPLTLL